MSAEVVGNTTVVDWLGRDKKAFIVSVNGIKLYATLDSDDEECVSYIDPVTGDYMFPNEIFDGYDEDKLHEIVMDAYLRDKFPKLSDDDDVNVLRI